MKFTYQTTIILFWILNIGIKAEPPSVSFVNIISKIISHANFIQENLIYSNTNYNQTLPWINEELTLTENGSNCTQDLRILIRDITASKTWALKTFDAWGKLPSGVLQGNMYWIGSVFECSRHLRGLNNTVVQQPFKTRTCVVNNHGLANLRPVYGMCVPSSCSANDLVTYINQRVIRIPFVRRFINLTEDNIHCIDPRPLSAAAILTIILLSSIAFLILAATGMHIAYRDKYNLEVHEPPRTGYESIETEETEASITTDTRTVTTVTTTLPADEHGEGIPLISRHRETVDTVAQNLISCCSLVNSYRLLKQKSQPKALACLNGIRVLSLWWVILGHTFVFAAFYSDNVVSIFNWSRQVWFQTIIHAVFSIDSFFLLSGLLTTFLFLVSRFEDERFSILRFLVDHYIYRYLRYTIFYALMILIYITLSPYLGQDGPIHPKDGMESSTCRTTWWRNLLYINNFFDSDVGCMPVSWFLAVNMQFHWIAPLFLLAVSWKWFAGMLIAIIFILIDIISTSVIVSVNNYDRGILSDFYSNRTNTTHHYMNDVYIKPWCRIAPYAIGLILGHILYELYKRANTLTWESILPQRTVRYNFAKHILAWIFALAILSLCVFGTYADYSGRSLTRAGRITFLTLSRIGWSVGLSIIIVICYTGHGGIVNKLLSHKCFQLTARLTYGAYLWHSLVIFVNFIGRDTPNHYTIANLLFNTIIHIMISYGLSFVTFLLIELPIIQLLKNGFQRRTIRHDE